MLNVTADTLATQAGVLGDDDGRPDAVRSQMLKMQVSFFNIPRRSCVLNFSSARHTPE